MIGILSLRHLPSVLSAEAGSATDPAGKASFSGIPTVVWPR